MKRRFILYDQSQRRDAKMAIENAPVDYVCTITEPRRSIEQSGRLHALIGEISKSRQWAGRSWDVETWKRLLTASWMRATQRQVMLLPALDGQGVEIYRRTSHLTEAELSELMDFVEAWHAMEAV